MSNLLGIYDSKKSMTGLIKINADTYNEIPSHDIIYLDGLTSNVKQQINTIINNNTTSITCIDINSVNIINSTTISCNISKEFKRQ